MKDALPQLSLEEISPALLVPLDETHLVRLIQQMSLNFTQRREELKSYVSNEEWVSAYSMFYLPTNLVKLQALLNRLAPEIREKINESILIDIGSGPGTFLIADRIAGGEGKTRLALETSTLMVDQAKKLYSHLFPGETPPRWTGDMEELAIWAGNCQNKAVLFGNSLNEMGVNRGLGIVERLSPQTVALIEPGTRESFGLCLEFRKGMIARGYSVQYPCLGQNDCPMNFRKDWCHQIVSATHDQSVERLSQLARLDRREMPACFFVFTLDRSEMKNSGCARLVQVVTETKFSLVVRVCLEDRATHRLERLEILKKSKTEKKWWKALRAGDLISFQVVKQLPDGIFRVSLV